MDKTKIIIKGARVNNLKNINVNIPRNRFVVITGLSGSGKSSLAFDTIYAEGNRRYIEGLSSYARNFLDISSKPDVDKIENLSPSISIDQKSVARSPRSTVGTLTEIYDYLRILFAKAGEVHCPECRALMRRKSNKEILDEILSLPGKNRVVILAECEQKNKELKETIRQIRQQGYARIRMDGKITLASEALSSAGEKTSPKIEVVIDRINLDAKNPDEERILDSIETAMKVGRGSMVISINSEKEIYCNRDFVCKKCGIKIKEITPRHFSFNNPEGACPMCQGLGMIMRIDPNLVIPNKKLSLAEGAVKPWNRTGNGINSGNFLMKRLAKKYKFPINTPVENLSSRQLNLILYGSAKTDDFYFKGIVPSLEKKYLEAKSDYARSEIEKYMVPEICPLCKGSRLKKESLGVLVDGKSIDDMANLSVSQFKDYLKEFPFKNIQKEKRKVVRALLEEIAGRLIALENVGLGYLSLSRSVRTISGGEAQRIRLAVQMKSQLTGVIYVLDEPSIGLHSRDTEKLIKTIKSLRDAGNSVIVVEHDRDFIKSADWIIDMGPGAGSEGGKIIFEGAPEKLLKSNVATAQYLSGKKEVFERVKARRGSGKFLEVIGASEHNLKNIDVRIPLGKFVAVCGVSGSGKSTLVCDILAKALSKHFYRSKNFPGKHKAIKGLENVGKVIDINQNPIGRTPRSNAATYTGVFSHIRKIFAQTEEAKSKGYTASRFSFNMKGGRCEVCQGEGMRKIEMHLLPDMYVKCEACEGARYNRKTLEIEYQGMNIAQVLDMNMSYAFKFFKRHPLICEKLKTVEEVGLGYLKLGQSATSLSGGEAQRIKLAAELARKSTGKTLYVLDEPSIGLHFEDIKKLLKVLDALVKKGNTVLVVEHNLDIIKSADWVIELGPEGGEGGGEIIFEGAPSELKKCRRSWTAKYL